MTEKIKNINTDLPGTGSPIAAPPTFDGLERPYSRSVSVRHPGSSIYPPRREIPWTVWAVVGVLLLLIAFATAMLP